MATATGIPLSKVSPAFLHANSTSHTWLFSAFAELIDNAYDPDVSASELLIDKVDIRGIPCLIFLDNGAGMDPDHLLKMLSFGFCEKDVYESTGSHLPIGHYGNGFKSGSMRIGKDALVFTRCQTSASIGFLSQTYLKAINADTVQVPCLTYRLPKFELISVIFLDPNSMERIKSQESRNNLDAILKFSVFNSEGDLKAELMALEGSKTGTKIIIYNLKRLQDSTYELDFSSDPTDIRCPEAFEIDHTSVYHRPIQMNTSEYKRSLKEYCSILFLRPRMKITIRGQRVKSKLISKSLSNTEMDVYKPTWLSRPVKIIFGFTCERDKSEDYGIMLYHRNRLIKAFEKVGYQKQPNDLGLGVVGVVQVDFLQPVHNKQDFNKDEKFNSIISALANKLNDYWNEKKGQAPGQSMHGNITSPDWLWVQCDKCLKWRRLPDGIDSNTLPDQWFCRMNPDASHNRCDIPEEPEDEDLANRPTYEKTFKKKQEERKRRHQQERAMEDERKRQAMLRREREVKEKEAQLRVLQGMQARNVAPQRVQMVSRESPKAMESVQKALAESRRREDQQKRLILQIQEQRKKAMEERNSLKSQLLSMAANWKESGTVAQQEILAQVQDLIGSFSHSEPTPLTPTKRKAPEHHPSPTVAGRSNSTKENKRMRIKTESGEEISIIENAYDDEDEESPHRPTSGRDTTQNNQSHANTDSKNIPLVNGTAGSVGKALTSPSAQPASSSSSAPKSSRKRNQKGQVLAVIDLTTESPCGDFVDVKPEMENLKAKMSLENVPVEQDVKPDKNVLDSQMSKKDVLKNGEEKTNASVLQEPKKEMEERSALDGKTQKEGANEYKETAAKVQGNSEGVQFGPSEDDPEFKMGIPESFQDNLEAAMAAIQDKLEKENLQEGQENGHRDFTKERKEETVKDSTQATDDSHVMIDSESSLESIPGLGCSEHSQDSNNMDVSEKSSQVPNLISNNDEDDGCSYEGDEDFGIRLEASEGGDKDMSFMSFMHNISNEVGKGRTATSSESTSGLKEGESVTGYDKTPIESVINKESSCNASSKSETHQESSVSKAADEQLVSGVTDFVKRRDPNEDQSDTPTEMSENVSTAPKQLEGAKKEDFRAHESREAMRNRMEAVREDADETRECSSGALVSNGEDMQSEIGEENRDSSSETEDREGSCSPTHDVHAQEEYQAALHAAMADTNVSVGIIDKCTKSRDTTETAVAQLSTNEDTGSDGIKQGPLCNGDHRSSFPAKECKSSNSERMECSEDSEDCTDNTEEGTSAHGVNVGKVGCGRVLPDPACGRVLPNTPLETLNSRTDDEIKGSRQESDVVGKFCDKTMQTEIDLLASSASIKCASCDVATRTANVQTDNFSQTVDEANSDLLEEMREKLKLKSDLLEEKEKKLNRVRQNIFLLLSYIVPDADLGDVENIEQVVEDMIGEHQGTSQDSQ